MFIIGTIVASLIGYFLGSFSFSIFVVRHKIKKDIREIGSKNAGATNASRVLGKKWGLLITLFDAFKIVLTALIAWGFSKIDNVAFSSTSYYIPCFFALIGHCYPIYYKFKGGKAVSCLIGLLIVTNWILFCAFTVVWWSLIFIYRKVSVSSLAGAIVVMVLIWIPTFSMIGYEGWSAAAYFDFNGFNFFNSPPTIDGNWKQVLYFNKLHGGTSFYDSYFVIQMVMTLSVLILIFKHRQNIIRIYKKVEPTFFEFKSKTPKTKNNNTSKKIITIKKQEVVKLLVFLFLMNKNIHNTNLLISYYLI